MKIQISEYTPSIIVLALFYFFAIFSPPLIKGVPIGYLVLLFMFLYITYSLATSNKVMHVKRNTLKFFYGFVPFILYVSICMFYRIAFSNTPHEVAAYVFNLRHVAIAGLFIVLSYASLTYFLDKHKNFIKNDMFRVFLIVALLQSFCIMLSYFYEGIQSLFIGFVLKNGGSEIMQEAIDNNIFRAYGLSGYYFDALAYVLSGLSILLFAEGLYSNKNSLCVLAIFVSLSSAMTARTGIVLSLIGFAIVFLNYFRNKLKLNLKTFFKGITIIFFIVLLCYLFYQNIPDEKKLAIEYAVTVTQKLLLDQEITGVYSQILLADVVFPDNVLFGLNAMPEAMGYYDNTGHAIDNGYIQVIWRFGVVGLLLLLFGHIYFFHKIYKGCNNACTKSIIIAFAVSLALYYIKIYPLNKNGANIIYFVIPLVLYYYENYWRNLLDKNYTK